MLTETPRRELPTLAQYAGAPLLLIITACLMMQPLSTDLYLASLPHLATGFGVTAATVQLTLSMFVLGFGSAQLIVGPLSDRFGRRPVLLGGLMFYMAASIFCALANSMTILIVARFVQALGACSAVVIARAVVRDAYAPEHSANVIAKASTWLSLAPLAGPVLGSYLQVGFGWRAAFIALTVLSLFIFLLVAARLPETNRYKSREATRLSGLAANYRHILWNPKFWSYALPGALSYGTVFAFISGSSLALISVLRIPTTWFGYCFATGVAGYLVGTLVCRRLLKSIPAQSAFRVGTALSALGSALFFIAVLAGLTHWSLVVAAMFVTMGAHGINFPLAQAGAVSPFPQQAGTAAGLAGALNMTAAFIVGTVVGALHDGTLLPLAIIVAAAGMSVLLAARMLEARA